MPKHTYEINIGVSILIEVDYRLNMFPKDIQLKASVIKCIVHPALCIFNL